MVSEVDLTFDINDKKEVKLVKKESKTVPVKELEADKKIAQARAEERRAMAVATEQEMRDENTRHAS